MTVRQLSLRKRLLYGLIIALVSVAVFFGALEAGLRLAGYGHDPRYFRTTRDANGKPWVRENRDFALTYFPPALVRRPPAFRIPAKKEPGTYRIFVLGSSAAMGDPEASFSLARTLEAMLRAAYPGRRFEVINAAITAINSHVVRAIAADCAELEPDLFIVYEGHNEVIGPFGPAAVLAPFLRSPRAITVSVGLKRTRIGQLVGNLAGRVGGAAKTPEDWGGMGMFLEHEITVADPRLADVQASFAANLEAIVDSARAVGARTLLCTVLTNQRDFAPFLSRHRTGLTPEELQRWDEDYAAGDRDLAAGNAAGAEAHYRTAWTLDDQHADLAFRLGRVCLAQQRDAEAREFLQRAVDLDALRFRTDSRLNDAIRTAAAAAARSDAAELVDVASAIATASPHGIVGDEMLYEHVHLTFRGTWEVARLLFARIGHEFVRRGDGTTPAAEPFDYNEARIRLGYTTYEQAMIMHELRRRFDRPPFTAQADHALRKAAWQERAAAADHLLGRPDSRKAHTLLYDQALAAAADDWVLLRNRGMAQVALGAPGDAIASLEKARETIDDDPDLLFALATALRATQRDAEAAKVFAELRKLEPRYPGLPEE